MDTQECGFRSVQMLSPDCIYTLNRRSRFASVLRITFEDAMLTQCDFYRISQPLLYAYLHFSANVVFKSTAYKAVCVENFTQIQI